MSNHKFMYFCTFFAAIKVIISRESFVIFFTSKVPENMIMCFLYFLAIQHLLMEKISRRELTDESIRVI